MTEEKKGILVKLSKYEKEKWKKYVKETDDIGSVSQLIRNTINSYIKGDLIEKDSVRVEHKINQADLLEIQIQESKAKTQSLEDLKKIIENQSKKIENLAIYIENSHRTFPREPTEIMSKLNIEGKIIDLIGTRLLTSEELAKEFKMTEVRILKFLNRLTEQHLIGLNKRMEYVLVESEKQIKDLKYKREE